MKIFELLEQQISDPRIAVVYGGRFQPFHLGHFGAYKWLCKKFGEGSVWLATSDKTNFEKDSKDISPFKFKEKVEIMTSLYKIKPRKIVKCKNPAFKPEEVFNLYKDPVVYVACCGEKDHDRYTKNDFFSPFPFKADPKDLKTVNDGVGYYVIVPTKVNGVSGTKAREQLVNSEGKEESVFKKFFGAYDQVTADLIIARLKEVK